MKRVLSLCISLFLITGCSTDMEEERTSVNLYFVADTPRGLKLFSEKREFVSSNNLADLVIADLISGKLQPLDADYSNLWDSSHSLNEITFSKANAEIDVNLGKLNVGSEGEQKAIEQIVWTLNSINPNLKKINFLVNGQRVETFAGHVDVTASFKKAPAYEVLNPIQITSIAEGQILINPVEISGKACTFEANVVWSLLKDGQVVKESFTSAEAGCPVRSKWGIFLGDLPPGTYLFEAKEFSAEDGSLFAIDTKTFSIR